MKRGSAGKRPLKARKSVLWLWGAVIIYGFSRFATLLRFSKIFKGTHIKYKKNVKILEGRNIQVFFDVPCGLQYDGETIQKTNHYTVCK